AEIRTLCSVGRFFRGHNRLTSFPSEKLFMIVATTPALVGFRITEHLGVVSGVAVEGMDVVRDLFAAFRNVWGGRSRGYEKGLEEARERALLQMVERAGAAGANAVIGVSVGRDSAGLAWIFHCSGTPGSGAV